MTEEQHPQCKRSCYYDVTPIDSGPPALYRLNTKRKYINGNHKKVRRWTYGQKDENKPNKVILLMGETGAGKTTMINTMINYLLEVKFEDEEFYQITEEIEEENEDEEQDQTKSKTSEITVYEVFVNENPTSLTIIDTPGYGNTDTEGFEKDREVSEYLTKLFSDKDGIHYIDAVCFVMKASLNRLSGKELYIVHSVLSLFGKDIEDNIVFLFTQSHEIPPRDALNAIKKAEIPCKRDRGGKPIFFLFNNQQKATRDTKYEQIYKSTWEMGERSMNRFFTLLDEKNRKSVKMTLDVMKKQTQLEACISNLMELILEKESKMEQLTNIQEAIKQNREKIEKCENFEFTVTITVKEKVPIEGAWWRNSNATCCSVCKENCHIWGCWWAKDPSECWVMKNSNCTVCTRKCHHSKHRKENKIYVMKTQDVIKKFDDLKKEYECTGGVNLKSFDTTVYENTKKEHERSIEESKKKTSVEDMLNSDLENIKKDKSTLVNEAYVTIMLLPNIALKADNAFMLQNLDFLIPRLKEEGMDQCTKDLEELQNAGEKQKNKGALRHVMDFSRQNLNRFYSKVTGKNQ
ncbi:uncharacterized protein LOC143745493 isoform X2 [Siphateles boraxobius]